MTQVHNGSVASVVAVLTPAQQSFINQVNNLTDEILEVCTPDGTTGRARFPEFRCALAIEEKLEEAVKVCQTGGERNKAFELLAEARRHFNNAQASYARRRLVEGLSNDMSWIANHKFVSKLPEGVIDSTRQAVNTYLETVADGPDGSHKRFELKVASELYWKALDALDVADEELKKAAAEAEAARQKAVRASLNQASSSLLGKISGIRKVKVS